MAMMTRTATPMIMRIYNRKVAIHNTRRKEGHTPSYLSTLSVEKLVIRLVVIFYD